jgi:hypothetical protein
MLYHGVHTATAQTTKLHNDAEQATQSAIHSNPALHVQGLSAEQATTASSKQLS